MKTLLLIAILSVLALNKPAPAMAGVNISIGISLPPLITFAAPPDVIVMPDTTGVYVVPSIDVDMYFWNGWWWRPWEGGWYRSQYYNRGWAYYNSTPSFYYDVDPGWRGYYRDRNWAGHRWDYQRVPNRQLQRNWKSWNSSRHWEKKQHWGVQDYQPRPHQQRQVLRQQRQEQYRQQPEVQRHLQRQQQQPERRQQQQPERRQQQQPERQQQQQPERRQQQQPERQQQQQPERQQHNEQSQPHGQQRGGDSQHEKNQERQDGRNSGHGR